MAKHNSILETIGDTPLVKLERIGPADVNIFVKVESFNPMGSVKDRMALAIIEDAERSGELKPGQTVIEATSGNTGIGLAMVCARKGYPLVIVMSENFSVERRKLLRFLGARVVLTPAAEKGTGMLNKAVELAEKHGYFLCRQFENPANAEAHERTTAQEIIRDFEGERLDYFVTGFGTGGTLNGIARALRAARPDTKVIAAEPDNSQVLGSGMPQPRDESGAPSASHPNFRPHLMQGWSPDFVSALTEQASFEQLIDQIVPVSGDDAMAYAKRLAREEGMLVGTSSGATLAGALEIAKTAEPGSNIVCMLPDTGERYLSTPLFSEISEEMNEQEKALSESTPGFRFDTSTCTVPMRREVKVDRIAENFTTSTIDRLPVVMFALEWCEFCWSVRNLFSKLGIEYTSIDLDSVEYQKNNLGGRIRAALERDLDTPTIPQIFVGGEHIGGCSEIFDEFRDGTFQTRCDKHGIHFDRDAVIDPDDLLPKWVHTRGAA
jgi:cysteine synthase A